MGDSLPPWLGRIYLLDPLGTSAFLDEIGRPHAVWGGAIRTFLPDVDPAIPEEALRHRVLSGSKILADPSRAAGILSALPRRLAAESPLPEQLTGVNRALLPGRTVLLPPPMRKPCGLS